MDPLRVLIVASDDGEAPLLRRSLPATLQLGPADGGGDPVPVEADEAILGRGWELGFDRRWDLGVVSLAGSDAGALLSANTLLRDRCGGLLFVAPGRERLPEGWRLRRLRDDVAVPPLSESGLRARIEILLALSRRESPDRVPGERIAAFLRRMVREGKRTLRPTWDPIHPTGFVYPAVGEAFGPCLDQGPLLDRLAGLGICRRVVHDRVRSCPTCGSRSVNFRESCPRCASLDFSHEPIIHHFACSHMDSQRNFQREGRLVCPKCAKELRQIGLDYEKPTGSARCNSCSFVFADAQVQASCLNCARIERPDRTVEEIIFAYELTQLADEIGVTGQIEGADLAAIVRSSSNGFYARPYFLHEVTRELSRMKRYHSPLSLLMVRLNNLDRVRSRSPARLHEYVNQIFAAVSKDLRTLDLSCVWSSDTLAVLLPETPLEGAQVVADRMVDRAEALDVVFDIDEPNLSVAAVACDDGDVSAETLIEDAIGHLTAGRGEG